MLTIAQQIKWLCRTKFAALQNRGELSRTCRWYNLSARRPRGRINWRITEMEDELRRRNEDCALMGKTIRSPRTSYARSGTDVRHQRKYRKGSIFKKSRRPLLFLTTPTPPALPVARGRGRRISQAA